MFSRVAPAPYLLICRVFFDVNLWCVSSQVCKFPSRRCMSFTTCITSCGHTRHAKLLRERLPYVCVRSCFLTSIRRKSTKWLTERYRNKSSEIAYCLSMRALHTCYNMYTLDTTNAWKDETPKDKTQDSLANHLFKVPINTQHKFVHSRTPPEPEKDEDDDNSCELVHYCCLNVTVYILEEHTS